MACPRVQSLCRQCRIRLFPATARRPFSSMTRKQQDDNSLQNVQEVIEEAPRTAIKRPAPKKRMPKAFESEGLESLAQGARAEATTRPGAGISMNEPYHLNVYAHKHNIHLTFTEPSRNPILSFSAGNIGLKKAQRGTFDAAYQLATYTMRKMTEKQWRMGGKNATFNRMLTLNEQEVKDRGIEVVMRGYGPGREAFQKALLGTEGKILRPMIKKVTDGTRLKFGGVRSRAVRRLG